MESIQPNHGKQLEIEVDGMRYARLPIKTHVVQPGEDISDLIKTYALPSAQPKDIIFISEKIVAIAQKRSIPIRTIRPSKIAKLAVRFVFKNPGGLGIATPWTMQMVIQEAGYPRFFFSCLAAIVTKPFGIRGMFYRLIGARAKAIDGPIPHAMPPYNECVTLSPLKPGQVASDIEKTCGHKIVIIDANDLGVETLGLSNKTIDKTWAEAIFRDNPLGQSREQTPLCLVRKIS